MQRSSRLQRVPANGENPSARPIRGAPSQLRPQDKSGATWMCRHCCRPPPIASGNRERGILRCGLQPCRARSPTSEAAGSHARRRRHRARGSRTGSWHGALMCPAVGSWGVARAATRGSSLVMQPAHHHASRSARTNTNVDELLVRLSSVGGRVRGASLDDSQASESQRGSQRCWMGAARRRADLV